LFQAPDAKSGFDVWTFTPATGAREPIVNGAFNETDGRWSPDGQSIAYVSDESGSPDIYVTPTRGGMRVRVSFAGGSRPRWRRDGRALFFLRGSQILRADVVGGSHGSGRSPQPDASPRFSTPRPVIDVPGIRDFDVAHRRDALVALVPAQAASPTPVTALVDWMSLVPTP
jgi:Tol biopolymer transport system component